MILKNRLTGLWGLLLLIVPFFMSTLNAATEPATQNTVPEWTVSCTSWDQQYHTTGVTNAVYMTFTQPSPEIDDGTCGSYIRSRTWADHGDISSPIFTYDPPTAQSPSSHGEWEVTVTYDTSETFVTTPIQATGIQTGTMIEYSCDNPEFPTSIGDGSVCESIPTCDEAPIMNSVNSFTSLCVTIDETTGYSCSYQQIENSFGALSGVFMPTSASCECADSPDGECYTPQEPPFEDGEECGVFGNYIWCASDPSQCESTLGAGGGTIPCGNCGTVNDTFMCISGDAPEAERCSANDTRPECEGTIEGDCPTGYQCDPQEADTDDTQDPDQQACTTGDTRPECQGVPDGQQPIQSEETAQLEQLNNQVDDLRKGLGELNKTAKEIRDRQLGKEDLPDIQKDIKSQESSYTSDLTSAINDTTTQDSFINEITNQFNGTTGTLSGALLPTLGCSPISINLPSFGGNAVFPICEVGDFVRPILAWIFALLTITRLFSIIYQTLSRSND